MFLLRCCRCWDLNDSAAIWWVIKGPVLASIMVSWAISELIRPQTLTFEEKHHDVVIMLFLFFHSFSADQLCALHRHHHHPRPKASVTWHRWKRVQYLSVSKITWTSRSCGWTDPDPIPDVFQEAGPVHAAAHPSLRDPLHRLRLLPREREQERASGVWTGPRIFPGEQNNQNIPTQLSLKQTFAGVCVSHLLTFSGLCGRRPLLFPEWRGKPPLNNNSQLHLGVI